MGENKYKIVLYDNIDFYVESEVIEKSKTLQSMFRDPSTKQYKPSIVIPDIDGQIFSHILAFIRYRAINEKDNDDFAKKLVENMDCVTLINVIHAANILDIKPLVKISGDRFKWIVKNNDVNGIRKIFKIKNDFSLEEEAQIEHNFEWT